MHAEGGPSGARDEPGGKGVGEPAAAGAPVEIVDDAPAHRYELREDGSLLALIEYSIDGSRITMLHTETSPAAEGRGLASRLVAFALDDARSRSLLVVPRCPFVRAYLQRHGEYRDVVAPGGLDEPPE